MKQSDYLECLDYFESLMDSLSVKNQLYIRLVTLCACIYGAEGWQNVENYGEIQFDFLKTIISYKNGISSNDIFRRFFRTLDPEEFQNLFRDWVTRIQPQAEKSVIAIDGKSSRHSFDVDKNRLHMASSYAAEVRLVLAQEKVDEKIKKITVIPSLLKVLDLRGNTVTVDAMRCQYENEY